MAKVVWPKGRPVGRAAALAVVSCFGSNYGFANPQSGHVVAGSATIHSAGNSLTVNQTSARAIINWQSFSIGKGQTTQIVQPSASSAILNRVTGGNPSVLLGRLESNGQVYLINTNGIMVGPNGVVDTRGFIASTLNVPDAAFQKGGSLTFSGGSTATITNLGTIKTSDGDVALIALHVVNGGTITAPNGQAILAGGNEVLYVPDGESDVVIRPAQTPGGASVDNTGRIAAASAQLKAAGSAYALAVNNGGSVNATGLHQVGGRVVLDGGAGDVVNSGNVTASGGTATLSGDRVAVTGSVDVSAPSGGGTIAVQATDAASVAANATLAADATGNGDGGQVRIKSQGATNFAGTATATGGPQAGNGGTAEISGTTVQFTGTVKLTAPKGATGTLVFDPENITVVSGNASAPSGISGGLWSFSTDPTGSDTISVGAIETLLGNANLELQASNSLTFATPTGTGSFVTLSSNTSNTLTLTAPAITVNASISLPNGKLVFNWPDADIVTFSTTAQSVTSASSATITAGTLQVAGNYGTVTFDGAVVTSSLQFTEPNFHASSITANNAANAISAVSFDPSGSNNVFGSIDVESSSTMTLSGNVANYSSATFVAGGDLTLESGFALSSGIQTTLASTGGVFNNLAGSSAFDAPNGKLRIYSSTNGTGSSGTAFNDNGIGSFFLTTVVTQSGVIYPSNPDAFDSFVEYFATTSALPTLTITADSFSRLYGQTDPTFTASYSGGSSSDLSTLPSFRILQGSDINAGSYTIQPYGAASSTDLLRYVNGALSVNPVPLSIAAQAASMTYGGTVPTFSATISGFVNGDTSSLVSGLTVTSNSGSSPPAGSYTITPANATVATPLGGVEPNYSVTYQTATFTVNPAPLSVSAVAASTTYGSAIPNFQLNFSGFVNASDAATVPAQFAGVTMAVQGSSVGTYPITLAAGNPNSNYTTTYTGANLTINPASLTITPNVSRVYGAALPAVLPAADFSGFVSGDSSTSLTTQPALSTAATVASGVGSYGITASGAVDPNYTISYAPGTLTVTAAPLTIAANNASAVYGSAVPAFTASYSGLVNGDASSVVSGLKIATNANTSVGNLTSPVGSYSVTPSGATASNYTISYTNGALSITPASLSITPTGTQVYGSTPSVSYTFSGLVNGDTSASLTKQPAYTTPAGQFDSVNNYPIFASGAADPNYTITYFPGTLRIVPATVTVTPASIVRNYGLATSTDNIFYSGFVNGDSASTVFSTLPSANTGSPLLHVGAYAVPFTHGVIGNDNYVENDAAATLTVDPTLLTVVANNVGGTHNQPLPAFTGTFSGFVNGDTQDTTGFRFTTAATPNSPPGTYPITLSGSDPDYVVNLTPGTLTLVSPPPTLDPTYNTIQNTTFVGSPVTGPTTITISTNMTLAPPPMLDLTDPEMTIMVRPQNDPSFVFGPDSDAVIANAAAAIGLTVDAVDSALEDPDTSEAMLAELMPFYMNELSTIMAQPQSSWTYAQSVFVNDILAFMNQQRQAAAYQAEDDYNAWYQQQLAAQQAQLAGLTGPAYTEMAAILSSNPPIPPDDFVNEATVGMSMTGPQAENYAAMQAVTEDMATNNVAQNVVEGTADTANIIKSATLIANLAAGTEGVADTGTLKSVFGNGLVKKIFITESGISALRKKMNKIPKVGDMNVETDTGDITKDSKSAAEIAADVSKGLEVGGVVLEVVGNLVAIGVGAADYGQLATYNTSFNNAVNADLKPMSVSDLQSMMNNNPTQVYSYMMNMIAGGNTIPPITVPPATPPSVYESL